MPSLKSPNQRRPEWLLKTPIAHRGFHNTDAGVEENSLSAFRAACDHGLSIEFDIRFSHNEIPMVFHDADLSRMTNRSDLISDLTAEQLKEIQLKDSSDSIPSLADVLENIAGRVPLIIEIKPTKLNRNKAITVIQSVLANYSGEYCIQSFDPFVLIALAKAAPHIIRGQLGMRNPPTNMSIYRKFMLRHMVLNPMVKPDYIGYDIRDLEALSSRKFGSPNTPIFAWTVRSEADLEKARSFADNVIFENLTPELVRKTGRWTASE